MITKILLGAMAVLVLGLTVTGWLLKTAWSDVARLEGLYSSQRAETQKAINANQELRITHAAQIATAQAHLAERGRDNARLRRDTQQIREANNTLAQALKRSPDRAAGVVSYLYARGMRDIAKHSGLSQSDRKIGVSKPAKAGRSGATENRVGAGPVLAKPKEAGR